jgi:UDP-2,3-diacylglucosamine hydrolase
MTTLFISDLHLDASRPHITRLFLDFLENEASRADALYILGDLFEAWIGDDASDEVAKLVADRLARLHECGVCCFFIHGNRDFLLGDAYARRARMTLLADPSIARIEGYEILLMHGDTLCADDTHYQVFRTQSRSPLWQRAFIASSIDDRRKFADRARAESLRYTRSLSGLITDVNPESVLVALWQAHVATLIHGHTHRPMIHVIDTDPSPSQRIVLGDWYEQGSVLRITGKNIELAGLSV